MPKEKLPQNNRERIIDGGTRINDEESLKAWKETLRKGGLNESEIKRFLGKMNDLHYENNGTLDEDADAVLNEIEEKEEAVKHMPPTARAQMLMNIKEDLRRKRRLRREGSDSA